MNTIIPLKINQSMEETQHLPAVSIIMPFEPKMSSKAGLVNDLSIAADKVEWELHENYPGEMAVLMIRKLNFIIGNLDFSTHKKSIAIYVSPVFEKVLYLDIPLEEKIIVDESFKIRDLVYSKKQLHKYLVLLLSEHRTQIYLVNADSFVKILSNTPELVYAYLDKPTERVVNFPVIARTSEIKMNKFLNYADNTLEIILNAYHLPLFVLGTEEVVARFKNLTKHSTAVIEYVQCNYENATVQQLKEILQPYVTDWKKVKHKDLLNRLQEAAGKKKLAVGIQEVWLKAMEHKGHLLVVEKNYNYTTKPGSTEDMISKAVKQYSKFSYIKDAVDDVIEKVLENGGDVQFADDDVMNGYHHIALIQN